ncbi:MULTISPECIES: hypothetical protein [unclassified Streptomyces]|uniref:hypothetical protein n=1 Tax=unclassified Streptomyces TaxID=2593676 RepID=UPI00190B7817|nr:MULTISPECIES: hypothetical protein [unclassified Streptomyces]MBK3563241.1 hypothetical protein [Streptomyces sp. MBT62]MBK6013230.1 hypothetical protein [Streptomyces sp. MBT53]
MKQTNTTKALIAQADGSGYRAAGLCAARHPSGVLCTLRRGHAPGHANPYVRKSVTDAVGLRW